MSSPFIAQPCHDGYDPHIWVKARTMTDDERSEDIEKRLTAGAWLRPGEVAVLFDKTRFAVDYWIKKGVKVRGERYFIGYRESPGGWRELDPTDVRKILAAYRTRRTDRPAIKDPDVIRPNPETPSDHSASPASGSQPPRPAGSDGHDR